MSADWGAVRLGIALGFAAVFVLVLVVVAVLWVVDRRLDAKHRAAEVEVPKGSLGALDRLLDPPAPDEQDAVVAWLADGAPKTPELGTVVPFTVPRGDGERSHLTRLTPDDLDRLAELVEFRRRQDDERARRLRPHAPRQRGAS